LKISKYQNVNILFDRISGRIQSSVIFFLFLLLFPLGLNLILTAHILNAVNYRAGNPSNPIEYQTPKIGDSPLWFSITPVNNEIIVTSTDGKIFRWPQQVTDIKKLEKFMSYLREKMASEIKSAALINHAHQNKYTVVISADRHITYAHLRPLIFALAEVGISNYALETKLTEVGDM
jgi:hypothetical protein